jgi:hypothetical protein
LSVSVECPCARDADALRVWYEAAFGIEFDGDSGVEMPFQLRKGYLAHQMPLLELLFDSVW